MEAELLKQRVAHHQLSPLLDSLELPAPPTLETIGDASLRQRLVYRYEQLVQRTKSEMMLLHIRTAEVKRDEANIEYEKHLKLCYHPLPKPNYETMSRFNRALTEIMTARFKLIEQRLQTLLQLKVRFFVKAPTVNKH